MLVSFDIDDTLLDDVAATDAAITALHEQLATAEPRPAFRERWLASLSRHYARYVAGEISLVEQRRIRVREAVRERVSDGAADALFDVYLDAYERNWALFADALPCLDALVDHRLAVISNGDAEQQRQKLARFGLLERFACVITSDHTGFGKPDPRIFLLACQRCGVSANDTVHVGDRFDIDVIGARGAGLRAIWLDRFGNRSATPSNVVTVESLAELPQLLKEAKRP